MDTLKFTYAKYVNCQRLDVWYMKVILIWVCRKYTSRQWKHIRKGKDKILHHKLQRGSVFLGSLPVNTEQYSSVRKQKNFYIQHTKTNFEILACPLCKMGIFYEPKKLTLWNTWHFVQKNNGDCASCLKNSVSIFVDKKMKCGCWGGNGMPILHIQHTIAKRCKSIRARNKESFL